MFQRRLSRRAGRGYARIVRAATVVENLESRRLFAAATGLTFDVDAVPNRLRYTFDADVGSATLHERFLLQEVDNLSAFAAPDATGSPMTTNYDSGMHTGNVLLGGFANGAVNGMLPDGDYDAMLAEGGALSAGRDDRVFFFQGDFNRDRAVTVNDQAILFSNWNLSGKTWSQGDMNLDGTVNIQDYSLFSNRFNSSLPLPPESANSLAVGEATESTIKLTWTAPSGFMPTSYRIWRSTDGIEFGKRSRPSGTTRPRASRITPTAVSRMV